MLPYILMRHLNMLCQWRTSRLLHPSLCTLSPQDACCLVRCGYKTQPLTMPAHSLAHSPCEAQACAKAATVHVGMVTRLALCRRGTAAHCSVVVSITSRRCRRAAWAVVACALCVQPSQTQAATPHPLEDKCMRLPKHRDVDLLL